MTLADKTDSATKTVTRSHVRRPKQYKVILLNDNYTTMDFVVMILETVFSRSTSEAVQIMLHVHNRGRGIAGTYPRDIAEAKVNEVHRKAKEMEYPLRCTVEEDDSGENG